MAAALVVHGRGVHGRLAAAQQALAVVAGEDRRHAAVLGDALPDPLERAGGPMAAVEVRQRAGGSEPAERTRPQHLPVDAIPGQVLVGALTGQHDRDVLAREA